MIKYIKKDITTVEYGVIAHGVNTKSKMGSGVAMAVKKKWPNVFKFYERVCSTSSGPELLGTICVVEVEPEQLYVANLFTQLNYGHKGIFAKETAILKSLNTCMEFCHVRSLPLYMPRIGCGLGGLDWESAVKPIVEELMLKYDISIFVCDL